MIGLGFLRPGDALPSVRELSKRLTINPATVSKAYQKLAIAGLLEVRRGEGTFVASELPALPLHERRERIEQAATRYVDTAQSLGIHREEAVQILDSTWRDRRREGQESD